MNPSSRIALALLIGWLPTYCGCGNSADQGDAAVPDGSVASHIDLSIGVNDGATIGATDLAVASDAASAPALGPLLGDFIGVNGFIDDPIDLLAAIGNVREYHNWAWYEGNGDPNYPGYPNNQNSDSLFNGYWDWDAFYSGMNAMGVFGYPAVQGGVQWLNNGAAPPVANGADPTLPASYAAHADEMFQVAARYGRVKVADMLLKLASDQKRLSGLGLLNYVEDWNEQDAWWILPNDQPVFSAPVYAAMASADYDGDQGRMAKTLGLKNADPSMKMVMGGLAGIGDTFADWETSIETYLDGMRAWSEANRGGDFPADVINVHHYTFGSGGSNPAQSPEDAGTKETLSLLARYRAAKLPGKELWLSEFGYDTDQQSPLHAPPLGNNSSQIVQGQWIVRSYLAILAAGFDRSFLYVLRDDCTGSCPTQFSTAGLTTVKGQWTPKPSYFFVATMRARLAKFAWLGEQTDANPDIRIYKVRDPASDQGAYIIWSATSKANLVPGFTLSVGAATQASSVALMDQQLTGTETPLAITSGSVKVDVSETPLIVLVDHIE